MQAGASDVAGELVAVKPTLGPVGCCGFRKVRQRFAIAVNESIARLIPGKWHWPQRIELVSTVGIVAVSGVVWVELADAVAVLEAYQETAVDVRASAGDLKIVIRRVSGGVVAAIEVILRERRVYERRRSWASS